MTTGLLTQAWLSATTGYNYYTGLSDFPMMAYNMSIYIIDTASDYYLLIAAIIVVGLFFYFKNK